MVMGGVVLGVQELPSVGRQASCRLLCYYDLMFLYLMIQIKGKTKRGKKPSYVLFLTVRDWSEGISISVALVS